MIAPQNYPAGISEFQRRVQSSPHNTYGKRPVWHEFQLVDRRRDGIHSNCIVCDPSCAGSPWWQRKGVLQSLGVQSLKMSPDLSRKNFALGILCPPPETR